MKLPDWAETSCCSSPPEGQRGQKQEECIREGRKPPCQLWRLESSQADTLQILGFLETVNCPSASSWTIEDASTAQLLLHTGQLYLHSPAVDSGYLLPVSVLNSGSAFTPLPGFRLPAAGIRFTLVLPLPLTQDSGYLRPVSVHNSGSARFPRLHVTCIRSNPPSHYLTTSAYLFHKQLHTEYL